MVLLLPYNIFPPQLKTVDMVTPGEAVLIAVATQKAVSATLIQRPADIATLVVRPPQTVSAQESHTAIETPQHYTVAKAIKLITAIDVNMVNDYAKQP